VKNKIMIAAISRLNFCEVSLSVGIFPKRAVMPSIKLVLVIIDPIALPNAKSPFPCNAATTDADNSGSVVPSETIVAPMITYDSPKIFESLAALSTSESAAFDNTIKDNARTDSTINKFKFAKIWYIRLLL